MKKNVVSVEERRRSVVDTPTPQLQQLSAWLQDELQEFTRVLRHRRDRVSIQQAVDRLRQALETAEAAVQEPQQRYRLPPEEQWGFVSVVAWIHEVKQELKRFPPPSA